VRRPFLSSLFLSFFRSFFLSFLFTSKVKISHYRLRCVKAWSDRNGIFGLGLFWMGEIGFDIKVGWIGLGWVEFPCKLGYNYN
jgi:hypothetical protein